MWILWVSVIRATILGFMIYGAAVNTPKFLSPPCAPPAGQRFSSGLLLMAAVVLQIPWHGLERM